jgi:hypothetical protein
MEGCDPALKDVGLTRADVYGIMAPPWWGRSRREFMRAAAERRNSAIERARLMRYNWHRLHDPAALR